MIQALCSRSRFCLISVWAGGTFLGEAGPTREVSLLPGVILVPLRVFGLVESVWVKRAPDTEFRNPLGRDKGSAGTCLDES